MNKEEAIVIIVSIINDLLEDEVDIKDDIQLVGGESLLDSMKLVELCIELEELADERGFEFDWTSENAMSKSRGMFRTLGALAEEFARQSVA